MDREELDALPCPFCGNLPMVFQYNGTMQARCQGAYGDCAGTDVIAPIGMWNKRSAADLLDQQAARIAELEAERDAAIRALSEEGRLRGAAEARADAAWCAGRNAASAAAINAIDDTDVLTPEHEILGDRVAEAILALTPPGAALGDAP